MSETLDEIGRLIERKEFAFAVTPNVDHVMRHRRHQEFRNIYAAAQLVVPDGVPLLWASKLLGDSLKERVNGTDLFERTCSLAAERGYSVYLLGGNPGAAGRAGKRLLESNPGLRIAGWDCPPPGFQKDADSNARIVKKVRDSGADILFVALGSPKQEEWIYRFGRSTGAKFAVGIGISFSLVGGDIKRAPVFLQRAGLEWLWRLSREPARLWKRYLLDDMPFLGLVLREAWTRRRIAGAAPKIPGRVERLFR
ncbi:MAG TPA: WecB/TagA/CpsF family glycosyltransferase [Bryobacteraceae bacterium]|jgi:N-acetylglucosaminyldiphosphoundecaprenol N-acetyl-beta-D-mannosaminyltransferase|nr:WecB/TagA/CpsF family glycosyltransferase [Bryobacteraceae bacterium]